MVGKSRFTHFYFTVIPIRIVWCQIETLVVWEFLRAVKNLLSAFFCWFFTLYIEIHIKKNNVNKSLADRHTFQYIYFCRRGRQFYLMDFFCVLFVLLWEDMSNKYAPESRAVWYRSIFFWNKMFHSYFKQSDIRLSIDYHAVKSFIYKYLGNMYDKLLE